MFHDVGAGEVDTHVAPNDARAVLRIVHTAMHGVGSEAFLALFAAAGFGAIDSVVEQADPDPAFPTVAFPNPEEPGALDLALRLAARVGADIVLANDPDADRLAVAVPTADGAWRALHGDEVGWLLADHLLEVSDAVGPARLLLTTVVSSSLLERMAQAAGVDFETTLTGFKWLSRAWVARPELRMVLAYEEALGYAVSDMVRDKDGLTAALVMADLAAAEKARGSSLLGRLADIEGRFGRHVTRQWSMRVTGGDAPTKLRALMARLRATPPSTMAGVPVAEWRDLSLDDPPADLLIARLTDGSRVIVRPSGTEPKCKVYVETVGAGADERADAMLAAAPDLFDA